MDEKLPDGWVETRLEDILPIKYGKGLIGASRDKDGEVPVYGSSGIVGYHNQALTSDETLIVGRKGSVGSVYYSPVSCWPIDTAYFAEKTASLNLKFFLHLLSSLRLVELDKSTAIPGLSRDDYNDIMVRIPPYPEQSRIVSVIEQQFTRLDSAVASLQSAKARSKQYRASLLKSAVEGELTREWRAEHSASETGEQLLARILQERRARWEEEQLAKMREKGIVPKDEKWREKYEEPEGPDVENLPELPEGWCWATVEQVADIGTGATPLRSRAEYYNGGIIPWVTSGSVNRQFILSTEEFITEKALEDTNAKIFPVGSLILAMYGEGKTRGKISELKIEAATNQACAAIVFRPFSFLCQPYTKYFFMSNYLAIRSSAVGGVQPNLNLTVVKETAIPLPPLAEQEQIVAEVEARLSNIEHLEKATEDNLKRAERERQSILQEAFAGRLVAQDPNDEPASILLERIREERKKREEEEKIVKISRKGSQMETAKKRQIRKITVGQAGVGLYEVLVAEGEPLEPQEVFRKVGLKTEDQPESVETFYEELRSDVADGLIGVIRPDTAKVLLEALDVSVGEEVEVLEPVEEEIEVVELAQEEEEEDEKLPPEWPTLWDELDKA